MAGLLGVGWRGVPELVVVTGAGSGIGRATAAEFGARGSRVVCADVDLASAVETAGAIPGGRGVARRLDVADPDEWERFGSWVRAEFGVADVVVDNAGIGMGGRSSSTPRRTGGASWTSTCSAWPIVARLHRELRFRPQDFLARRAARPRLEEVGA